MSITVATMTLARDPDEERTILDSLGALSARGLRVIVADGGSPRSFLIGLESLSNVEIVAPLAGGLVGQIASSLRRASEVGARRILYTEPDKLEFFRDRLDAFLTQPTHGASVVIAGRSDAAMETYPPMQRLTESSINAITSAFTGVPGDYCYGPFIVDGDLVDGIEGVDLTLGWGWRFELFARAHRGGRRLLIAEGEHVCPIEQRTEEAGDRLHRVRQLAQNIQGILGGIDSTAAGSTAAAAADDTEAV